ncbi:MAG TPA: hypothetical protein VGQ57_02180, partial [Polyangiaceae bacterium]|nr:hypothetical protein [Polyangiaceae bacterium]
MRRSPAVSSPPDEPLAADRPEGLGVGQVVGEHFRIDSTLDGDSGCYLGVGTRSSQAVVFLPVSAEREKTLRPLVGFEHAHLGRLYALEPVSDTRFVAVAAVVRGETLAERLAAIGKKPSVDAVRTALRLADALSSLHEAGGVHGFVSTRAVIVEPTTGEQPILVFYPHDASGELHTPERAPEGAPSIADDTWACAALLHWMLTGKAPPPAGYASTEEIEAAGVTDAALRTALIHTLTSSRPDRQSDLKSLRRELARWFVEHAGEEPIVPSFHPSAPPPLPPSKRPSYRASARRSSRPPTPAEKRKIGAFTLAAIGLGLVAGAALTFLRPKRVQLISVPEKVEAPATASALQLGDVPVTGENEVGLGSKLATCMAGYLPKGTFTKAPDVEWLCGETDPRVGAEKLHSVIVAAGPKGAPSDAMKIFSRIGWYAMPAFAVVRSGCCPDAAPLSLPESQCKMDARLRDVGDAVVAVHDVVEPLKAYTDSIHCELNHGGAKMLRRAERPAGGE